MPARSTDEVLALVDQAVGRPPRTHNLQHAEAYGPFDQTFMDGYEEMMSQSRVPQYRVSGAFKRQFGGHPTPLEEGIPATVEWDRDFLASSA